jgi:hypothetical protein
MNVAGCAKRGLWEELRWCDFGIAVILAEIRPKPGESGRLTLCEKFHIIRSLSFLQSPVFG